jgi:hypothetical protein
MWPPPTEGQEEENEGEAGGKVGEWKEAAQRRNNRAAKKLQLFTCQQLKPRLGHGWSPDSQPIGRLFCSLLSVLDRALEVNKRRENVSIARHQRVRARTQQRLPCRAGEFGLKFLTKIKRFACHLG